MAAVTDHLIFHLSAAMGAMGEFAGHERRGSLIWPGRSAIIGLLGAAMGIRRDGDFSALDRLRMAVAIFQPGEVMRDYHTVQTVPTARARRPQSRPDALRQAGRDANTTITLRDYRMGVLYGVAVWGGDLAAIAEALRRPVFTLYLGRKSCPLSAPVDPRIVGADTAQAALGQLRLPVWHRGARAVLMASDDAQGVPMLQRHDVPTDRARWHFAPRQVGMVTVDITPEVAQ